MVGTGVSKNIEENIMAAIDLNTVRGVIEGRLNTELASSPAVPVVFYNKSYTPTPSDSFV